LFRSVRTFQSIRLRRCRSTSLGFLNCGGRREVRGTRAKTVPRSYDCSDAHLLLRPFKRATCLRAPTCRLKQRIRCLHLRPRAPWFEKPDRFFGLAFRNEAFFLCAVIVRCWLLFLLGMGRSVVAGPEPESIVFCSYNLENFSEGTLADEASRQSAKPKSAKAIETQFRIIREISPDVLGVCEMGSPAMLERFRSELKRAGLDFSHTEYVAAADDERHLALLSRFPIVARDSQPEVRFELNGREEFVRRGILDVTLQLNAGYRLRCVGVHLKSQLPVPQGEALIRRFEAQKLRQHVDRILATDANTNLICYGDFNDNRNEPMFHEVIGVRGSRGFLTELPCADAFGDRWTHYWKAADQYSRIDYLFASQGLLSEVNAGSSRIYRSEDWNVASDHRPIFTSIRPVEK
jgi:endonuclease/exonuclease/phosphatase family metal-dependent hydrolase